MTIDGAAKSEWVAVDAGRPTMWQRICIDDLELQTVEITDPPTQATRQDLADVFSSHTRVIDVELEGGCRQPGSLTYARWPVASCLTNAST